MNTLPLTSSPSVRVLIVLLFVAAPACYSDRTAGERPSAKPKLTTVITAQPGEVLSVGNNPAVGDIDGDGLDDFLLGGLRMSDTGQFDTDHQPLYLFYGKSEYPAQLSTADADAVFEDGFDGGLVGDVDGDGLADLMLSRLHSVEFVFGSKKRLRGAIAPESTGPVWTAGELPPPFAAGLTSQFIVHSAGDLDGDGCADLLVDATGVLTLNADAGIAGGVSLRSYLVRGHRGTWDSATWDPSWAAAGFGFDSTPSNDVAGLQGIYPEPVGDVNGDGRADILALTGNGSLMFYGRREYPSELTGAEADARLLPPTNPQQPLSVDQQPLLAAGTAGDLDGDGKDDLALINPTLQTFQMLYGQQWSGESEIDPQLTVTLEMPGHQTLGSAVTGDIDGDGYPELLITASTFDGEALDDGSGAQQRIDATIYVLRGRGERRVGTYQLTSQDRLAVPLQESVMPASGALWTDTLRLAGDVDGDGSQEILGSVADPASGEIAVYLVPSTPKSRTPARD